MFATTRYKHGFIHERAGEAGLPDQVEYQVAAGECWPVPSVREAKRQITLHEKRNQGGDHDRR